MKQPLHKKILSPARLVRSFKYAFNGLTILVKEEQNYVVHLTTATIVVILGFYYKISSIEWIVLVLAIQVVLTLETINTAIENLADFVSAERNDKIMRIKDLAAAGVLIAALTAMIIGLIIFLPKMFGW
jgi:possible diacylglycerol kinase